MLVNSRMLKLLNGQDFLLVLVSLCNTTSSPFNEDWDTCNTAPQKVTHLFLSDQWICFYIFYLSTKAKNAIFFNDAWLILALTILRGFLYQLQVILQNIIYRSRLVPHGLMSWQWTAATHWQLMTADILTEDWWLKKVVYSKQDFITECHLSQGALHSCPCSRQRRPTDSFPSPGMVAGRERELIASALGWGLWQSSYGDDKANFKIFDDHEVKVDE